MSTRGKTTWILVYLLAPVPPVVILFVSLPAMLEHAPAAISMAVAIAAYVWFTLQPVLTARPRWIERHISLGLIYKFHGLVGTVALVLAILHGALLDDSGEEALWMRLGEWSLLALIFITVFAVLFLGGSVVRRWGDRLARWLRLRYNTVVLFHNAGMLAVTLALLHVLFMPFPGLFLFKIVLAAYYALGLTFYLHQKVLRRMAIKRHPFKVKEVVRETNGVWTVKLISEEGDIPDYKPGQFLYIRFPGRAVKNESHPFTISSSPSCREHLGVTIKEVGAFTASIGQVQAGDTALVEMPFGDFTCADIPDGRALLFIAGGIGITPMLSMLRYLNDTGISGKGVLIWSARTREDLICLPEIEAIMKRWPEGSFIPVLSRDEAWAGRKGRLDREKLVGILAESGFSSGEAHAFVCGPPPMMHDVRRILKEQGFSARNIHTERFSW